MIDTKQTKTFFVEEKGDFTQNNYSGEFEAKMYLAPREILNKDKLRRELLGTDQSSATTEAADLSIMISEIRARCVKVPSWFMDADYGLALVDTNVIYGVFEKLQQTITNYFAEVKGSTDKAKDALVKNKEEITKPPV